MSDWSAGYVADIGYTYGAYAELNPLRIKLAFLSAGLVFPEVGTACELGFGQGMSINAHAAASVTQWHGTDFNPSQAGFAQELARNTGSGAQLWDQSFAEFCQRDDLPDFDFVGLHGIWSWVSDENRGLIVDFLRRKLKVGGVVYISYNTFPGHAPMVPVRELLNQHSALLAPAGSGTTSRVAGALGFMEKLVASNPRYIQENPELKARFEKIRGQDASYLAHEYFNRDWAPMPFIKVAEWLSQAKLSFACSANFTDHVDALNLTQEQHTLLAEIENAGFRETVRDFILNQQFRRDYWVRGPRQLNGNTQQAVLAQQRIVLTGPRENVPTKIKAPLGEVTLNEAVYGPVLDVLADNKVHTAGEIMELLPQKISWTQLAQALNILLGIGQISPANDEAVIEKTRATTAQMNRQLLQMSRSNSGLSYLISPVIGGPIHIGRINHLLVAGRQAGLQSAEQLADYALEALFDQGKRVLVEGKSLETREENRTALVSNAADLLGRLSLFKELGFLDE